MVEPMFLVGKNPDEPGDDMDMEEVGVAFFVAARESSSWWELSTKFPVVLSILLLMLCPRPRRPCAQGIGRTEGSPVRWSTLLQFLPCAQRQCQETSMRNLSVTDCDGVPSEYDAIHVYFGELEIQCIATSETYAGWEFLREDEIAGFFRALSFLS